ncbi:DUF4350 domain-containing protein [Halomarina salina]|uniref:DUF4350 domain-containing protein n=1 Tax=Halomarina salina TaxID=1872699 RepID=A0ABD5RS24_9EURY|nr:DUF4350 domain-containing protein [Halomarina salina]
MRTDLPRIALWVLTGVVLLGVVVGASTSGAAYGAFNPSWDGGSSLRTIAESQGTDAVYIQEATEYRSLSSESVAFILAPDESYSPNESAQVQSFVERGGTVVVADDSTGSNSLLASVGASSRVDGRLVRDERRYYRGPALPVATNVTALNRSTQPDESATASNLTASIDRLTLNYGSVLQPGNATVLVSTSEFAYLDSNRNEELDDTETLASRPVATVESIGEGHVVTVSDSSALINAMLDRQDNRAFIENLISGSDRVALDYSHTASLPPLAYVLVTFRASLLFQLWVGILFIWAIAVYLYWPTLREQPALRRLRHRIHGTNEQISPRLDAETAATALRRRRPDWDEDRIQRVATALGGEGPRDPWRGTRTSRAQRGEDPSDEPSEN